MHTISDIRSRLSAVIYNLNNELIKIFSLFFKTFLDNFINRTSSRGWFSREDGFETGQLLLPTLLLQFSKQFNLQFIIIFKKMQFSTYPFFEAITEPNIFDPTKIHLDREFFVGILHFILTDWVIAEPHSLVEFLLRRPNYIVKISSLFIIPRRIFSDIR